MVAAHLKSIEKIIHDCIERNLPFAIYKLPNKKQIHFILQNSAALPMPNNLFQLPASPGFIFYPFRYSKMYPAYFIRAERIHNFYIKDIVGEHLTRNFDFSTLPISNMVTGKSAYCKKVKTAIRLIRKGKIKKVVLSRLQITNTDKQTPLHTYINLCKQRYSAFVSLVYIPDKVLWLSATPELLVSAYKGKVQTMALAGTRKAGQDKWTSKERDEQKFVANYVYKVMGKHCSHIITNGPNEAIAGNVAHLKTTFAAKLNSNLGGLVAGLHPTPAVCGTPKDKALKFIADTEQHDRKYYAGFLGPCNLNNRTDLFVNLRCAQLSKSKAGLYIGGGIMSDSVPNNEWNETVLKADTMLSALKSA